MALTYSYISATDSYSVVSNSCTAGAVVIPSTYNNGINGTKPVTSIGNYAFFSCIALTSITIPNSVTSIGYGAFNSCPSLASITIGNSVTSIEETAFYNCTSLASISVDSANNNFSDEEGVLFNKNKTTLIAYPNAKSSSYTIPNSVTSIEVYAFRLRTSLASVTIGNGVTGILDTTFYGCSSLISVTIGNSVTGIGSNAFFGCSSLASVIIPNSVTSISVLAFYSCGSLTNLTIPKSVTSIGSQAFESCGNLVRINFLGNAPSVGGSSFVGTNVNLKFYRKKNFVTGWSSTLNGIPVVLISDNVVKSGGSGKLIGKKRYLYIATGIGLSPNINGLGFYDSGLIYNGKKSFYSEDYQYAIWYWGGFPTAIWLVGPIANIGTFTANNWGKVGATDTVAGSYFAGGDKVGTVIIS